MLSILDRLAATSLVSYELDRRTNPHRFLNSPDGLGRDFLFVENVARMLACNVDFVRRIPRHDLPAAKVGPRLIYRRADVEAFISRRIDAATPVRQEMRRRPSSVHRVAPVASGTVGAPFDPVDRVRQLLKNGNARDKG